MANKGRSEQGLFGTVHHYDEHGNKIGRSEPGLFGGYTNYDAKGDKTGHSDPGLFGGYNHYDNHGKKIGSSDPGFFGSYNHRDSKGKPTGSSAPGLFGSYSHNNNQGCYVATCVYGSYDCPPVWVLRRFRDYRLAKSLPGRIFIKLYYFASPKLVKCFGNTKLFKSFCGEVLDKMVFHLITNGVKDTPYNDK